MSYHELTSPPFVPGSSETLRLVPVEIPKSLPNDIDDIALETKVLLDLYCESQGYTIPYGEDGFQAVVRGSLRAMRPHRTNKVIDAEQDELKGFVKYRQKKRRRELIIESLAVTKQDRGHGIGSFVMSELITIAKESELREMRVISLPNSVNFYERHGFTAAFHYSNLWHMYREVSQD